MEKERELEREGDNRRCVFFGMTASLDYTGPHPGGNTERDESVCGARGKGHCHPGAESSAYWVGLRERRD